MSLLTPADLDSSYGGTGTYPVATVQLAIDLAEFDIEDYLGIPLSPTSFTEEYLWPTDDGMLQLRWNRVTSITTVTAKHSLDEDCVWAEDTQCGVILQTEPSRVKLVACKLSLGDCNCSPGIIPDRAVVTYIAGFAVAETAANTALGKALRMAIALRTREWINVLTDGQNWEGSYFITNWSSMDYSERREFADTKNALGPGPFSQEAVRLLRRVRPYFAIMLRSTGRIHG